MLLTQHLHQNESEYASVTLLEVSHSASPGDYFLAWLPSPGWGGGEWPRIADSKPENDADSLVHRAKYFLNFHNLPKYIMNHLIFHVSFSGPTPWMRAWTQRAWPTIATALILKIWRTWPMTVGFQTLQASGNGCSQENEKNWGSVNIFICFFSLIDYVLALWCCPRAYWSASQLILLRVIPCIDAMFTAVFIDSISFPNYDA